MVATSRQMKLGAFLPAPGHHVAAWRHPNAQPDGGLDFRYYAKLAETAERGKFDLIFLSDGVGIRTHYKDADELSRWGRRSRAPAWRSRFGRAGARLLDALEQFPLFCIVQDRQGEGRQRLVRRRPALRVDLQSV